MTEKTPFAPKDLLIFVPIVGSALAISFEIGSFWPLGRSSFGIFSTGDHLTFALEALPAAFMFVLFAGFIIFAVPVKRLSLVVRRHPTLWWSTVVAVFLAPTLIFVLAWFVWPLLSPGPRPLALLVASPVTSVLLYLIFLLDLDQPRDRSIIMFSVAICLVVSAFCVGSDFTRSALALLRPSTITTDDSVTSLVVIRVNATALIGFDREKDQLVYIKGDRIKERSWYQRGKDRASTADKASAH